MTETKRRKGESVEDLDAKILEMEAELADGHGRPLCWDEVTSTTPDEMARKEQRREVWKGSDGFAHDGERLFAYSRAGTP